MIKVVILGSIPIPDCRFTVGSADGLENSEVFTDERCISARYPCTSLVSSAPPKF